MIDSWGLLHGIGRTVCSRNRLSTGLVQSFQLSPDIPNRLDLLEELLLLPIKEVVVAFVGFVEVKHAMELSVAAFPVLVFLLTDFFTRRRDTPASGAETAMVESSMLPPYMLTAKLVSASCAVVEGGPVPFRVGLGCTYKSSLASLNPSFGLHTSTLMYASRSELANGHARPRVATSALVYRSGATCFRLPVIDTT